MPILRVNFFALPLNYNFQITCEKYLGGYHKNKFRRRRGRNAYFNLWVTCGIYSPSPTGHSNRIYYLSIIAISPKIIVHINDQSYCTINDAPTIFPNNLKIISICDQDSVSTSPPI